MDRKEYQELQFRTLRTEIENCSERSFKIMVGGAALIPVLAGILVHYSATVVLLALPLVVVVMALLYLNQRSAIMRCGRYIRTKIEPDIMGEDGWETWLESVPDNRRVDNYLVWALVLLSFAYYGAATYISWNHARMAFGLVWEWVVLAVYIPLGLAMVIYVLWRVPKSTSTKKERAPVRRERSRGKANTEQSSADNPA
jgi:MFS family permease